MGQKRFCFIYCVDNQSQFEESLKYINQLNVPEGYTKEYRAIKDAPNIFHGYNQGMNSTNAKYKVYLHQDVDILNQNFIPDCLDLFLRYPRLGMLGVAGAKRLPKTGVWWAAPQTFGKVYHTGLLAFAEVVKDYEVVQAIDGLIMITQYDRVWREDLLRDWHFYDISQSLEFIKAGYQVGVPRQTSPWCRHHHGDTDLVAYELNRNHFFKSLWSLT